MKKLILVMGTLLVSSSITLAQRAVNNPNSMDQAAENTRRQMQRMDMEQRQIQVIYEKNMQNNYDFTCVNKTFCSYIVEVNFTELQNLQSDLPLPVRISVPPGSHHIFTLRKTTLGLPVRLSYRYTTFKGCLNPKVDTAFTYLLPVAPGKETRTSELYYIAKKLGGEPEPKGWYALGFHVNSGDTVFASRSGRVTETLEQADLRDSGISYARGENFVEICHNDCSFAKYRVFRDNSIFVHPGDWVEAGQPIGIAGGDKYSSGPQTQISVYYNYEEEVIKDGQPTGKVHHWAYVPLQFWTKDKGKGRLTDHTTYVSEHPAELITREMTKKEAKKWASNHKS